MVGIPRSGRQQLGKEKLMSIARKTQFIVEFEGGTEFQQRMMRDSLKCVITTWKTFYELKNRRNIINLKEKEYKKEHHDNH